MRSYLYTLGIITANRELLSLRFQLPLSVLASGKVSGKFSVKTLSIIYYAH
jgi:hypothetical protein